MAQPDSVEARKLALVREIRDRYQKARTDLDETMAFDVTNGLPPREFTLNDFSGAPYKVNDEELRATLRDEESALVAAVEGSTAATLGGNESWIRNSLSAKQTPLDAVRTAHQDATTQKNAPTMAASSPVAADELQKFKEKNLKKIDNNRKILRKQLGGLNRQVVLGFEGQDGVTREVTGGQLLGEAEARFEKLEKRIRETGPGDFDMVKSEVQAVLDNPLGGQFWSHEPSYMPAGVVPQNAPLPDIPGQERMGAPTPQQNQPPRPVTPTASQPATSTPEAQKVPPSQSKGAPAPAPQPGPRRPTREERKQRRVFSSEEIQALKDQIQAMKNAPQEVNAGQGRLAPQEGFLNKLKPGVKNAVSPNGPHKKMQ
jgi:hypothetical protein